MNPSPQTAPETATTPTSSLAAAAATDLAASPWPDGDPRPGLARAMALAGAVIGSVAPAQFHQATPCPDFDVRRLTGHMLGVVRRIAAVGRGEDPLSVAEVVAAGDDSQWPELWAAAVGPVEEVWSRPGMLERPARLPFATLPGAVALAVYTSEVTVHTWDLAAATGQQPDWDDGVVGPALVASRRILPAQGRGQEIPFGPVAPVPDDAPLIDQLVAWNGRHP